MRNVTCRVSVSQWQLNDTKVTSPHLEELLPFDVHPEFGLNGECSRVVLYIILLCLVGMEGIVFHDTEHLLVIGTKQLHIP